MNCRLAWRRTCLRRSCLLLLISSAAFVRAQAPGSPESSSKAHKSAAHAQSVSPDSGSLSDGIYRNSFFGFIYKAPYGWVDRTQEMQEQSEPGKSQLLLLAIFERPPQAAGSTVNSAVIIAAESAASYPGLKTATDYFEPLTEVTTSKGFKVVNEPYEFQLAAKQLVRADFSKDLGSIKMLQSTVAMLQRRYVVSFTFIAGTDEEVDKLLEGLSFGEPSRARVVNLPPRTDLKSGACKPIQTQPKVQVTEPIRGSKKAALCGRIVSSQRDPK